MLCRALHALLLLGFCGNPGGQHLIPTLTIDLPSPAPPRCVQDVGSGIGGVHNYYLFDKPQKTVVRTPFVSALHPMPPSVSPVGLGTAKVIAGLAHSGLLGVLRMLLWAK